MRKSFFISGYGLVFGYHDMVEYFKTFRKRIGSVLILFLIEHLIDISGYLIFGIPYDITKVLQSLIGQATLVRNDGYVPAYLIINYFWQCIVASL